MEREVHDDRTQIVDGERLIHRRDRLALGVDLLQLLEENVARSGAVWRGRLPLRIPRSRGSWTQIRSSAKAPTGIEPV
jgi:hypothetical protein